MRIHLSVPAAVAAILALPALAGASVVSATSVSDSASSKTITVSCPAGQKVTGAGGDVTGGLGRVALTGFTPNANLTAVSATAREDETATRSNWTVKVYGLCQPDSWGLHLVAGASASNSVNKSAVASCPAGERVFGAAGYIVAASGEVILDDLTPNSALSAVTVTGAEDATGYSANWGIRAYAVCGKLGGHEPLERIVATSPTDSNNKTALTPVCPAGPGGGGSFLVGLGADITGGVGEVVLDMIAPLGGNRSWVQAYEDANGAAFPWSVRAYSVCLELALS